MALLSDDADFYVWVSTTLLLSATIALAILRGWIRGHSFRPKKSHLTMLVYSLLLARDALRLWMVHGNIPESYRCRCPGAVGLPAAGECVLVEGAYIRDLLQVADRCFLMMLVVGVTLGDAIWEKRMPPRPRVAERRGLRRVGGILFEILLFIACVLACINSLPLLLQDYMAATANGGDAAVA